MTPRIYPVARYTNARAAIAFFERAFGFTTRAIHDGPDGSVAHAELAFGTGTIGLSSAGPVDSANVWTTVREGVYVCLADPDTHCARARAAGARIEQPLRSTDYGAREYTARDPEDRLWSFGTYAMADTVGPPTFVPELRYRDGDAAVAFLTRAFGFARGMQTLDDARDPAHTELWLDASPLFIASGDGGGQLWGDRTQCTQVHVIDPDAHCARARAAGAVVVRPPAGTHYGARAYLAQDPEGFLWRFSSYVPRRPD